MTVEAATNGVTVKPPKVIEVQHPLDPLTETEITTGASLIRQLHPSTVGLRFKAITLEEPKKDDVLSLSAAEKDGRKPTAIARRAFVSYYIQNTDKFHEAIVNLSSRKVERNIRLGPNVHGPGDAWEVLLIEKTVLEDESVKQAIVKYQLPEGTRVIGDPWIYGSDGIDDDKRQFQCWLYAVAPSDDGGSESNHYAMPLDIAPVLDTETMKVLRIDRLPTGPDSTHMDTGSYKVPQPSEYLPEYQKLRTDLKPLHVIQPEGASFKVIRNGETGNAMEWQKWHLRIGFNQREGMVLYDVRYSGRSLFYRLSLSDMNIPYGDPRPPYHRKAAFDLGDAGAGTMANNLKLGCDCLGSIHYLDGVLSDPDGAAVKMENVICIHEQDGGISFKHLNYRSGRGIVVRNRELVVQTIITVANYDYVLAFIFNQAGEITYEVRATGILSTTPINHGVDVPWGTVVHPGVLAAHHQHIFSLRVDPALDGQDNRLVYNEAYAMPREPELNPHGTGYRVEEKVVDESGGFDLDFERNRTFLIQNSAVKNPVNGKPVAYKIQAPPFQTILADKDSFHYKRAEFADHSIYVTKYQDGELYAGGKYTNQSRGGAGVRTWANRKECVRDTDIVVWIQFGINHITRVEDFPIMPVDILRVSLKPVNFFDKNPALDVPPSAQHFNRSVLLSETHRQPTAEISIGADGQIDQTSEP